MKPASSPQLSVQVSDFQDNLIASINEQGEFYLNTRFKYKSSGTRDEKIKQFAERCFDVVFQRRENIVVSGPILLGIKPYIVKLTNILQTSVHLIIKTSYGGAKDEIIDFRGKFCRFVVVVTKKATNTYVLNVFKESHLVVQSKDGEVSVTQEIHERVIDKNAKKVSFSGAMLKTSPNEVRVGPLSSKEIEENKKRKLEKPLSKTDKNLELLPDVEKHGFTTGYGMQNTRAILDRMKQSESYKCENTINMFNDGLEKIIPIFQVLSDLAQKIQKSSQYARLFLHGDKFEVCCSMCPLHCPHRFSVTKFKPRGRPKSKVAKCDNKAKKGKGKEKAKNGKIDSMNFEFFKEIEDSTSSCKLFFYTVVSLSK